MAVSTPLVFTVNQVWLFSTVQSVSAPWLLVTNEVSGFFRHQTGGGQLAPHHAGEARPMPHHIKRALDAELYFFSRIFGFQLADRVEEVLIENL